MAVVIVLIALSGLSISKSRFGSDIERLVPSHAEKTALYFDLMETFGGMEKLYIVFSSDDVRQRLGAVDNVGAELLSTGLFKDVEWKITEETKSLIKDQFVKKMPLYLTPSEMALFLRKLSPQGIKEGLTKTKTRLSLPGGGLAGLDPLGLSEAFEGHMRFSDVSFDMGSGYFITPDGGLLIMTATPKASPRDIKETGVLLEKVRYITDSHSGGGMGVSITGSHAITHYEASLMKKEIAMNVLGSLVGVALIVVIAFGGARGFLSAILPVAASIVIATGLMAYFLGTMTEVSGAFGAIMIGLGVDLGIVLYVRFAANLSRGLPVEAALDQSAGSAGPGILFGVLTTAATFLPMAFSSFRGIREIGLLTGAGILITLFLVFLLSPVLMKKGAPLKRDFGLVKKLFSFSSDRPYTVIAAVTAVTVFSLFFIGKVRLEGDITRLGAKHNPARETLQALTDKYLRKHTLFLTGRAGDPDLASIKSAEAKKALGDNAADAFGLSDILPPRSLQLENIEKIKAIDPDSFERSFRREAAGLGFDISGSGGFGDYIKGIKAVLSVRNPVQYSDLAPINGLIERFIKEDDNGYRFFVTSGLKESAPIDKVALKALGVEYTGPSLVRDELLGLLLKDALLITLIGIALVNILLYADFRRLSYVVLAQVPVFLSVLLVLGFMGITGITLNFMNAIFFVMLFGIGTDYSIHLIHRYKEGGDVGAIAGETGSAILLAGLTTIVGFGSMAFSSYRGLSSMGAVTGAGVFFCVILSLTLVPASFSLYEKITNRK